MKMETDDIYGPSQLSVAAGNLHITTPSSGRSRQNETSHATTPEDFRPRSDSTDSRGSVTSTGTAHGQYPLHYTSTVQHDLSGHSGMPSTSRPLDYSIPAQARVRTFTGMPYSPSATQGPPNSDKLTNIYHPHTQVRLNVNHTGGYVPQPQHSPQGYYQPPYQIPPTSMQTPQKSHVYLPSLGYDMRGVPQQMWQEQTDNLARASVGNAERPVGFDKALQQGRRINNTGYSPNSPPSWQGYPQVTPRKQHPVSPSNPPQLSSAHSSFTTSPTSLAMIPTPLPTESYQGHSYAMQQPFPSDQQARSKYITTADIDLSTSGDQYDELYKPTNPVHQPPSSNFPPSSTFTSEHQTVGPVSMPSSRVGQFQNNLAYHPPQQAVPLESWQHQRSNQHTVHQQCQPASLMDTPVAVMPQGTAPILPLQLPEHGLQVEWNQPGPDLIAGTPPNDLKTSRSGSINSDDQHYTKSLVLHQRARMDKLVKDLEEARKMLNGMQTEVKQLEKTANHRRLVRSNSFPKVEDVQQLREVACKLQVDIQLMTRQMDILDNVKPVANPQEQTSFYGTLQPGQQGSVHTTSSLEMPGLSSSPASVSSSRTPPVRPPPPRLPPQDDDNVQWSCVACTFLNHPLLDKCEQCEMPRVPPMLNRTR